MSQTITKIGNVEVNPASWFASYANVVSLGAWLVDHDEFTKPSQLQRFYEKPWNYSDEWAMMQLGTDPDDVTGERCQRCRAQAIGFGPLENPAVDSEARGEKGDSLCRDCYVREVGPIAGL
jgi:hypothetical protein